MNEIGAAIALAGCALSLVFGWRMGAPFRFAQVFALAVVSVVLGVVLSAAAVGIHGACEMLGMCQKMTDTTVWGMALPLMASPAFWLLGVLAHVAAAWADRWRARSRGPE
jgi:hypothetical protein